MEKKDIKLIRSIVVLILLCFIVNLIIGSKRPESIEIYVENKLYKKVPIDSEQEFKIETSKGYNKVKVHDRGVEIVEASCPDKTCVHMGMINKSNQNIVCIPNKVNIKITTDENDKTQEDIIVK